MKLLLGKHPPILPDFNEIHTYSEDLVTITKLRDSVMNTEEKKQYDNILDCMQKVMLFINQVR